MRIGLSLIDRCRRTTPRGCRATIGAVAGGTIAAALLIGSGSFAVAALDNGQCFDCHGDSAILKSSAEDKAGNVQPGGPEKEERVLAPFPDISLFVDKAAFATSVHKDLSCTDCHADIKDLPHSARLKPVDCSGCHSDVTAIYEKSRHRLGVDKKPLAHAIRCSDCHGAHAIEKASAPTSPVFHRNVAGTCNRCHAKPELVAGSGIPGAGTMYQKSVHNIAITEKGSTKAASCPDCHGAHDVKERLDPTSPIYRANIPTTCGKCHYAVWAVYKESVHGVAYARHVPDAPGCSDCHGEHEIRAPSDPRSSVSFSAVSEKTCPSCHGAEKLAKRYGIAVDKVQGYRDSFHGLSEQLGDKKVANCASCHGTHEIFKSSDPRSTVNVKNLRVTCAKCHPGAGDNFAKGNIHVGLGGVGAAVKYYVRLVYLWLIGIVIGGMVAHNVIDYALKVRARYRKRLASGEPMYERLSYPERMQHFFTFGSFFVLAVTGFALKFKWSIPFLSDHVNVVLRSGTHRVAAAVMVATCLYHIGYVLFTRRGRDHFIRMMPTWKDFQDFGGMLLYFAGLTEHRPKFGRFGYAEKAEYLALVWGSVIMIGTGLLLWFQNEALKFFPMWGLDVATLIHYYEAVLATLAIVVWHFYFVIVNPDFTLMSFTWIDGKLTRHEMEHEHPLELEEIEEGHEKASGQDERAGGKAEKGPEKS